MVHDLADPSIAAAAQLARARQLAQEYAVSDVYVVGNPTHVKLVPSRGPVAHSAELYPSAAAIGL